MRLKLGSFLFLLSWIPPLVLGQNCDFNFDPSTSSETITCEPVLNNMCKATGYNMTHLPNIFNHSTQQMAEDYIVDLRSRFSSGACSEYLEHFLCSAVFPICLPGTFQSILPCEELCSGVRESCLSTLKENEFEWPSELECSQFSSYTESLCVWTTNNPCVKDTVGSDADLDSLLCNGRLILLSYSTQTSFGSIKHCAEPCNGVYFDKDKQYILSIWVTALSLVTLIVGVVIVLTCLLTYKHIPSIESPIYYTAMSYGIVSIAYIISVGVGKDALICENQFQNSINESALLVDPVNHPFCLLLFCITYYGTLCTWNWWFVCTVQWLICCLKNSNIENKWRISFHFLAWGTPLVFTLIALCLGYVSGDSIVQNCWIKKHYELAFLVGPLFVLILLCCGILLFSFARVVKLQRDYKTRDQNTIPPQSLIRVGLYCTVHLIPMGVLCCIYFYEFWYREDWEKHYITCANANCADANNSPLFPIFMLKIAATLAMGILSVFWVFSQKMIESWKKVCCFCYSPLVGQHVGVYHINSKYSASFQHSVTSSDSSV